MQSEQTNEIFTALSKAQAVMTNGKATKQNPYLKNVYSSIEDIWNAIRDPFAKNGLTVIQLQQLEGDKYFVITILGHSSGQWIKSFTPLLLSQNTKNPMQELGSAITYAKRYGLSAISGFSVSDSTDDDGQGLTSTVEPEKPTDIRPASELSEDQKSKVASILKRFPDLVDRVMQAVNYNLDSMQIAYFDSLVKHASERQEVKHA